MGNQKKLGMVSEKGAVEKVFIILRNGFRSLLGILQSLKKLVNGKEVAHLGCERQLDEVFPMERHKIAGTDVTIGSRISQTPRAPSTEVMENWCLTTKCDVFLLVSRF